MLTEQQSVVCMPTLLPSALLLLRVRGGQRRYRVRFELLPRYLRALGRLGISEQLLVRLMTRLTGYSIEHIPHGDAVPGYPAVRADVMHKVVSLCIALTPSVRASGWTRLLARLLGEDAAEAHFVKQVAHQQAHLHLLAILVCRRSLPDAATLAVVPHPSWPQPWVRRAAEELAAPRVTFVAWPTAWRLAHAVLRALVALVAIPMLVLDRARHGGVSWGATRLPPRELLTELVDPERLRGSSYDADYLVDGVRLGRQQIRFYLGREQVRLLGREGCPRDRVSVAAAERGYEVIALDALPLPLPIARRVMSLWWPAAVLLSRGDLPALVPELVRAIRDYLELGPLFARAPARRSLHINLPHGRAGVRTNSAVVTGLCRAYGVSSVGLQSVMVDVAQDCHAFDCYDRYLSWGRGWQQILGEGARYLGEIQEVGCVHLDGLVPSKSAALPAGNGRGPARKVAVLPSDVLPFSPGTSGCYGNFYTRGYALAFLRASAALALRYPSIQFTVKTKLPEHLDSVLQDPVLRDLHDRARANFHLVKRARSDYASVLAEADIVLAIGFTTPGVEGLLLGKRLIYYSQIRHSGHPFAGLPAVVAESDEELQVLFADAVADPHGYGERVAALIGGLDPFRDGAARGRIHDALSLGNGVTGPLVFASPSAPVHGSNAHPAARSAP